jgi:hypothetical protein
VKERATCSKLVAAQDRRAFHTPEMMSIVHDISDPNDAYRKKLIVHFLHSNGPHFLKGTVRKDTIIPTLAHPMVHISMELGATTI